MKYSLGITNSKKKKNTKSSRNSRKPKSFSKAFSPTKFDKFKSVKKYSSNNTKKGKNKAKSGFNSTTPKSKKKVLNLKTKKAIYIGVGVLFFLVCLALIGIGIYLKNLQDSLPSPDELVERSSDQSTQILDREGELLYTVYGDQNREFVSLDEIPEYTKWAVLSAEDIEFYQHKGIDYFGIAQAFIQNLRAGGVVRGGSTITQQLVKSTILYDVLGDEAFAQTYSRKIKEVLITMQVEQSFTKDEILQMYMNEIPLGGVNYGFQAAANAYFDKDVDELTLAESALLAGLIQSPGIYSPLFGSNPEMAEERQEYVLNQMYRHRKLTGVTEEEIEEARKEEIVYTSKKIDINAPHFVFYVKQLLEEEFGEERVERGGLKVTTSLDSSLQTIAEEEITKGVEGAKRYNVNNGSMVVLDPKKGEILAMVGSVDYFNVEDPRVDGNVNIVTSNRQMGSSVKPFVYLTAINRGYGPWLLTPDISEISFGNYKPTNWDKKYEGLITARRALVQSRNVPAVYTLQLVGIDNFLQIMEKVGVPGLASKVEYGLSLGLGSGEMRLLDFTNAYATLANSGVRRDIVSILKVEDSKGEVLFEVEENPGTRVIDEKEAYLVNWMICDLGGFNDKYGNQYYNIGGNKLCGKTGTTDGPRDLLAFMYNQNIVVGVWTGNNNNESMPGGWSSTVPLPLASSFMRRVIENYPSVTYNRPAGILTTSVCKDTGATRPDDADWDCEKEASLYIAGRPPQVDKREVIEICKENGLIPSNLDAAQKYGLTEKKVFLAKELENSLQQEAYEKYLTKKDDSQYITSKPESGVCPLPLGPDNAPVIDLVSPSAGQSVVKGRNLEISGQVRYLESISTFEVKFDGSNISGASLKADGSFVVNYFVPEATTLGDHTITVLAVDNYGKTDTENVAIKVVDAASAISVSMTSPLNGQTFTRPSQFPVVLVANISGGTVEKVTFQISQVAGSYSKTLTDTDSAGGWSQNWTDEGLNSGDYTIQVSVQSGESTIIGPTIRVTVN
ncbi:MAG TPA: transglycosylase domain-containing protein, partial [Candidatus Dojkabacteria bacterium]|nr:transglycosylase domain-containing protein [Candidatus Dojkabacteria bacterium]